MSETIPRHYDSYGVSSYHNRGVDGSNVAVYIIGSNLQPHISKTSSNVTVETFSNNNTETSDEATKISDMLSNKWGDKGIKGIIPSSSIYLADVDSDESDVQTYQILSAIYSAISKHVDIIGINLETSINFPPLKIAIKAATDAGILVLTLPSPSSLEGNNDSSQNNNDISNTISVLPDDESLPGTLTMMTPDDTNIKGDLRSPGTNWDSPSLGGNEGDSPSSGDNQPILSLPFATGLAALELSDKRNLTGNSKASYSRDDMLDILKEKLHPRPPADSKIVPSKSAASVFQPKTNYNIIIVILVIIVLIAFCYLFLKPKSAGTPLTSVHPASMNPYA